MKQETKIIIIGVITTILILSITLFSIYKINSPKENSTNNPTENNNKDLSNGTSSPLTTTVTVHIFKSSTCGNCKNALAFFENIVKDYDYLEVVTYEASEGDNYNLMQIIGKKFNLEKVTSVPFIIIGNEFHQIGYSNMLDDKLKETITKERENENYQDLINELIKANPGNYPNNTLKK